MKKLSKGNVYFLGLVSLFTDLSSQMIYPLIPEFLVSMGATKFIIGLIEGIAESIATIFRSLFGHLSDRFGKRKIFIYLGYGLSAVSKPFLYLSGTWIDVMMVKFADRVGKSIRSPARDALISTSVAPHKKGKAFGFHRAMDRTGAIGGPLLAMLILGFWSNDVRLVFLLSAIPALLALVFILFTRETTFNPSTDTSSPNSGGIRNRPFLIFTVANIFFALGNSSNAFLILKAREAGLTIAMIPLIWMLYNAFCTVSSPIFGTLSDKIGRRPLIMISFAYYAVLYFLFGFTTNLTAVWILFAAYGIYYGLSEGASRAYIADLVAAEKRATAYGIYNTSVGLALFPASIIMGSIWDHYGSALAFYTAAAFSLVGFTIFVVFSFMDRFNRASDAAA